MATHTWTCPACRRRVPLRVTTCHCGVTREQAEAQAEAALAAEPGPSPRARRRRLALPPLPGDVRALLVASALVLTAGLGWLVLGPRRPEPIPAVLGHVDAGAPPVPKPTPAPRPPFRLPWWK